MKGESNQNRQTCRRGMNSLTRFQQLHFLLKFVISSSVYWTEQRGVNLNSAPKNYVLHRVAPLFSCLSVCGLHNDCKAVYYQKGNGSCYGYTSQSFIDSGEATDNDYLLYTSDAELPIKCRENNAHLKPSGCYLTNKTLSSNSVARDYCQRLGGYLLRINTQEEYNRILPILNNEGIGTCWSDGDNHVLGLQYTYTNGESFPHLFWVVGHPKTYAAFCVQFDVANGFLSLSCSASLMVVCEIDF